MRYLYIPLLVCAAASFGNAMQTDWSGGEQGGVTTGSWGSFFLASENVSSFAVPGEICLGSDPLSTSVETPVDPNLPLAGMAACDIDSDGFTDLACASLVEGHVWWFRNQSGNSWEANALPGAFGGALGCSFFDMDTDGYQDIIGSMCEPDCIVIWPNESGTGEFSEPVVVANSFPGVHIAVGCFADEDDLPDIMAAGNESNEVAVFYGLGNGQWEKVVIDPAFSGTQSVSPGDIDGDGDTDAVGASLILGEFAWWENPGNREDPWVKHMVAADMPGAHHTVAVDMNLDGLIDVLGSSFSNGKITWWENDGGSPPNWELHTVAPGLTGVLTAVPGDFDGDNDLDVAGASWVLDRVVWYENQDGEGENWHPRAVKTGFNGAWPLATGDFRNCGRIGLAAGADVLNGSGESHGPSVFDLCGFCESGWLTSCVLDTQEDPQWASFQFQGDVPQGCVLSFRWRSSDDSGDLGEWSDAFYDWANLSGDIHRFVQYKVEMEGVGAYLSPVLHEIELFWDPNGVQSGSTVERLFSPVSSPSCGGISLTVPGSDTPVTIRVIDLLGRVTREFTADCSGETLWLDGLSSGVYLISAVSGSTAQSQKFCMIN